MILGVLIAKKKYPLVKYLFVLMIVCGVALFLYKNVSIQGFTHIIVTHEGFQKPIFVKNLSPSLSF